MVLMLSITTVLVAAIPGGAALGALATLIGAVLAGVVLLAMDGRPPGALGFYARPRAVTETLSGLGLGTVIALVVVAAIAVVGGVRWSSQEGSVTEWVMGGLGALTFLAVPAAAEEALLRGYPLQAVAEAWGPAVALTVTSVAFGALHLANPGVTVIGTINVIGAGVLLGIVYLRTASLWWATGVHLGWNWAHGYVADVPVSGLELLDAPFYDGVVRGAGWVGGGSFGPEGSLVTTVLVVAASVWCWKARWLRPSEVALGARPLTVIGERS